MASPDWAGTKSRNLELGIHLVLPHLALVLNLLHLFAADAAPSQTLDFHNADLQFEICILLLLFVLVRNFLDLKYKKLFAGQSRYVKSSGKRNS